MSKCKRKIKKIIIFNAPVFIFSWNFFRCQILLLMPTSKVTALAPLWRSPKLYANTVDSIWTYLQRQYKVKAQKYTSHTSIHLLVSERRLQGNLAASTYECLQAKPITRALISTVGGVVMSIQSCVWRGPPPTCSEQAQTTCKKTDIGILSFTFILFMALHWYWTAGGYSMDHRTALRKENMTTIDCITRPTTISLLWGKPPQDSWTVSASWQGRALCLKRMKIVNVIGHSPYCTEQGVGDCDLAWPHEVDEDWALNFCFI